MTRFNDLNQIQNIRRWFQDINLNSADILTVEREIWTALLKSKNSSRWLLSSVAPLAEPMKLDELVGDIFRDAYSELQYQLARTDNLYTWLTDVNNYLKSEMETIESVVTQASDDIQGIALLLGDVAQNFLWVSDNFNNTIYIDQQKTTALIETDYGQISLGPSSLFNINNFDINIDRTETVGIPGCNMLVINVGKAGTSATPPQPVLESASVKDLSNVFDNDPTTWFEIERNFVVPVQKCINLGQAFQFDSTGTTVTVEKATLDYDWKVFVQWPNSAIADSGPDGKGLPLAEFKDPFNTGVAAGLTSSDFSAKLVFDVVINPPQPISSFKLLPFIRNTQGIQVESITAYADNLTIPIVEGVQLSPTSVSISTLEQTILRRTGNSTTGGVFTIPTDRNISKIRVKLSSGVEEAPLGLAHPFNDQEIATRTVQKILFISSVKHSTSWVRIPVNETPPQIISKTNSSNLFGSILSTLTTVGAFGQVANAAGSYLTNQSNTNPGANTGQGLAGGISSAINTANSGAQLSNASQQLGGTLKGIGGALGSIGTIVGGVELVSNLISAAFGRSTTKTLKATQSGYDIFKGYRSGIGIRDIALQQIQYQPSSTLYTTARQFSAPVSKIALFLEQHIPANWGPGNWITCYISVDGTNWTQINPLSNPQTDVYTPPQPTKLVYLKFDFLGNPSDPFHSPHISNYALQGSN